MDIDSMEGFIAGLRYGKLHRFTFSTQTGWLFYRAEVLLRQYGVPVYGREIVSKNEQGFSVRPKQAVWAEHVLCKAGVPLTCVLLDGRNQHYGYVMPRAWKSGIRATTTIGKILDFMDWILP
jgi:hypothetical protein